MLALWTTFVANKRFYSLSENFTTRSAIICYLSKVLLNVLRLIETHLFLCFLKAIHASSDFVLLKIFLSLDLCMIAWIYA